MSIDKVPETLGNLSTYGFHMLDSHATRFIDNKRNTCSQKKTSEQVWKKKENKQDSREDFGTPRDK